MNLTFLRKLDIPMKLKEQYPLSLDLQKIVQERDIEIKNILSGKDDRKILIVGPCSADNFDSVLDYCHRLKKVYDKVKEKLLIVPRIYTSKPRTNAKGYKGLLHQPDPSGKEDMWNGIISVRNLHMKVLTETGLNGADELLYTENYKYIDDIVCYVAVGSRSVENQEHRLTASGLSIPVGMKNPMSGNVNVMLHSILAAQNKHTFIYRGWEVKSEGNPYAHAVIRGYTDKYGKNMPNYKYDDLLYINELYEKTELKNKALIVDCSHANSDKNPMIELDIAMDVLSSCKKNNEINKLVKGLMLESYIEDGAQLIGENIYGKSITDPCLGWDKTEKLIFDIADRL